MKRVFTFFVLLGLFLTIGWISPVIAETNGPKTYPVFFDLDSSTVPVEAINQIEIAAELVKNLMDGGINAAVLLYAHADRSGTHEYNLRLSHQRGESVRAELIRLGVPENRILISVWGSTRPVPSSTDRVEAQHRRVDIKIGRATSSDVLRLFEENPSRVQFPDRD